VVMINIATTATICPIFILSLSPQFIAAVELLSLAGQQARLSVH
jgi:hypothetical protein